MARRQQHKKSHRLPQRSPDRTKLWHIGLWLGKVYVASTESKLRDLQIPTTQLIRSITPQAAARRFIRNTLPGLYMGGDYMDTGFQPGDIGIHHSKNRKSISYDKQARKYQDDSKKRAKNTEFVVLK